MHSGYFSVFFHDNIPRNVIPDHHKGVNVLYITLAYINVDSISAVMFTWAEKN